MQSATRNRILSILRRAASKVRFGFDGVWRLVEKTGGLYQMATTHASEELLAAPLPDLIQGLGVAVAEANKELAKVDQSDLIYTINEAEIEVKVAISVSKETEVGGDAGLKLSAFNVNASYSKTYSFKEEASSHIKLTLAAVPRAAT